MTLKNVCLVRTKELLHCQKTELGVKEERIIAIETYDSPFSQKIVPLRKGLVSI